MAIAGLRRGAGEVIVPLPILFLIKFYSLFPELSTNLFAGVNWLLPKPGGMGKESVLGRDSHSAWSPSMLTYLGDRAAQRNNERPATEPHEAAEVNQVESTSDTHSV